MNLIGNIVTAYSVAVAGGSTIHNPNLITEQGARRYTILVIERMGRRQAIPCSTEGAAYHLRNGRYTEQ